MLTFAYKRKTKLIWEGQVLDAFLPLSITNGRQKQSQRNYQGMPKEKGIYLGKRDKNENISSEEMSNKYSGS